jgi:hypothetical protein
VASYYYLAASLPLLKWDEPAPMSVEEFLRESKSNMESSDYSILEKTLSGTPCSDSFAEKWVEFQTMVDKELSEARSKKLQMRGDRYKNSGDKEFHISETVRNAVNADNPLQGEMMLLQLKWGFLDDASVNHTFDLAGIISYCLKLRLLERKTYFNQADGNKEFERLLGNLNSIMKGK